MKNTNNERVNNNQRSQNDFPKLSAPALRALLNAKIGTLADLKKFTEKEVLDLHGMGPNALGKLQAALKEKGWEFKM